ncbi:MAG: hypothetical protein JNM66_02380 [Bryobacterales bacterium]|nr:hypothetical protein [Bryobacterales bacterium]
MTPNARRVERLTLLALFSTFAAAIYYWPYVDRAFRRNNNLLGQTNVHVPTADLFLYCVFALILYCGARFWAFVSPKIFDISEATAAKIAFRLQVFRVLSTFTLLALTLRGIHSQVPDFIDKLPWP